MLPFITPALEAFVKLLEKIIDLEKTKKQDKQTLFKEVVKPLFDALEPVASNYIDIFRKARKSLDKTSSKKLRETIELISRERQVEHFTRIKVGNMAQQIKEQIKDEEVVAFAETVLMFVYDNTMNLTTTRTSRFLQYLEQIETNNQIDNQDKTSILKYIDETLEFLENSWSNIVRSYEKLKIYSVSPPKYIHKRQAKSRS